MVKYPQTPCLIVNLNIDHFLYEKQILLFYFNIHIYFVQGIYLGK